MSGRGGAQRGGGRGAYYKAKYGGRGRGRGSENDSAPQSSSKSDRGAHRDWQTLTHDLQRIDRKSYNCYKDLTGDYHHADPEFILRIDHVQGDAYASPSRVRTIMPLRVADFPDELTDSRTKRIALADFITRTTADFIRRKHMDRVFGGSGWSGPKGGAFNINAPGQEILERTSCVFKSNEETIELRFTVSLPAQGRTILGDEAHQILALNLPDLVKASLLHATQDQERLADHVRCVVGQNYLREQLQPRGFVAFIANGSILPRQSGSASLPMSGSDVMKFKSPAEFETELEWPDCSSICGMAIPRGVTVLTGGGFHGKSTLLEALQMGIYDHVPGDGRELVVADPTAFKIRAEDGRSVENLDISPFISTLPGNKDVNKFSTEDASGSTSMAANIQEALELGCRTILIDEDSSATNLLVRDQRMQRLIQAEPIIPFVSKARALFKQHDVSTIIVVGGCGDYLSVADHVIGMESYLPKDLSAAAEQIVYDLPSRIDQEETFGKIPQRSIKVPKNAIGKRPPRARGTDFIGTFAQPKNPVRNPSEAESGIELSCVEQFTEPGQVQYVINCLRYLAERPRAESMASIMDAVEKAVSDGGLDAIHVEHRNAGDMVLARRFELGAAINRLRGLLVQ